MTGGELDMVYRQFGRRTIRPQVNSAASRFGRRVGYGKVAFGIQIKSSNISETRRDSTMVTFKVENRKSYTRFRFVPS